MEYQVTIFCATGKYRPVSTIIRTKEIVNLSDNAVERDLVHRGLQKICAEHGWTSADLKKTDFRTGKVRLYDKEKIMAENKARYEALKEAKYASGEWKRPTKKKTSRV